MTNRQGGETEGGEERKRHTNWWRAWVIFNPSELLLCLSTADGNPSRKNHVSQLLTAFMKQPTLSPCCCTCKLEQLFLKAKYVLIPRQETIPIHPCVMAYGLKFNRVWDFTV